MARLLSTGFELNSKTAGVEVSNISGPTGASIVTSPVNGGTYAAQFSESGSTTSAFNMAFLAVAGNGPYYARAYVYFNTATSNSGMGIMSFQGAVGSSTRSVVTIASGGKLQVQCNGTSSSLSTTALTTGQWYRIEFVFDAVSNNQILMINGNTEITFNKAPAGGAIAFAVGVNVGGFGNSSTNTVIFDDIAVNDSSGSFQTSFPGPGLIIHQNPAGAGDSTGWSIAGSSPAATNWQSVNETPPDDAVTLVNEALLSDSDFYTVGISPLGASDTVNVVQVGGRFNNDTADAISQFQFQIEKASGGTVAKSSAIIPNSTTWRTNSTTGANCGLYPIVLYQDPDSSNWTQTTINGMQIGQISGTVGVNKVQVTKVWALVDYTPGSAPPSADGFTGQLLITSI